MTPEYAGKWIAHLIIAASFGVALAVLDAPVWAAFGLSYMLWQVFRGTRP